jgi:hypothetical protein
MSIYLNCDFAIHFKTKKELEKFCKKELINSGKPTTEEFQTKIWKKQKPLWAYEEVSRIRKTDTSISFSMGASCGYEYFILMTHNYPKSLICVRDECSDSDRVIGLSIHLNNEPLMEIRIAGDTAHHCMDLPDCEYCGKDKESVHDADCEYSPEWKLVEIFKRQEEVFDGYFKQGYEFHKKLDLVHKMLEGVV